MSRGDGSVYRRADGMWVGAYVLPNGQRRYKYAKTQRDVREKLRRLRIRVEQGRPVEDDRRTVAEYLQWWIQELRRSETVRYSTWQSYETKVRLHLTPTLGRHQLGKLRPIHVQEMMSTKRQEGLSPRSVQYIHAVLHRALEQARKWELVDRNVAGLVDPPRVPKREARALTVAEGRLLLDAVEGDRYEAFYRVALMLGLRRGEALALRWEDVDLEAQTLRVCGTLRRVEGRWEREGTKTHSSQKTLPLPKSCVAALVKHRGRQDEERLLAGSLWVEHGLVFTREDGQPVWFHYINRHLEKVCKEAGLPSVTPHELRHSAASLLLAQGVDQRTIMEILRHSTIRMTADLYTHIVGPQLRDAMDRMDEALG